MLGRELGIMFHYGDSIARREAAAGEGHIGIPWHVILRDLGNRVNRTLNAQGSYSGMLEVPKSFSIQSTYSKLYHYTPGLVKSSPGGQLPICAGSPPTRT